jgi:hypothetical protein
MLKRQDDERLQRSGDEIRPVRAGVTVLPLHIHQSLGFSAFVVGLVTTDPSLPERHFDRSLQCHERPDAL